MQPQTEFDLSQLSPDLNNKVMSEKYVTMDTRKLVDALLALTSGAKPAQGPSEKHPDGIPAIPGTKVFEIHKFTPRKVSKRSKNPGQGNHFISLRTTQSYMVNGEECFPTMLIVNSYDGSSVLSVETGIFRVICTNGMIVKTKDFGKLKVRHLGVPEEEAFSLAKQFAANLPKIADLQLDMSKTELTDDQKIEFAMKAAQIRWEKEFTQEDAQLLLEVKRPEDEGNDLWKVFNRVQEKCIQGNIKLSGQKKTAKPIQAMWKDANVNRDLFELAMSYMVNETTPDPEETFQEVTPEEVNEQVNDVVKEKVLGPKKFLYHGNKRMKNPEYAIWAEANPDLVNA